MKNRFLTTLLLIPLLAGCPGTPASDEPQSMPDDYVPANLPDYYEDKNTGAIKSDEDYVYFDIYGISDFHGAVNYNKDNKELGLARLSSYYDKKREDNPGGTLLLSSGDMWQGSADSNLTRGTMVTYSMNLMDFDSMALGNHEFDWTIDWIKNNKERANFPLVCANLINKDTHEIADFVTPSTIIERGQGEEKYKIGVVGTIGDNIKNTIIASAVAEYEFADEIQTVKSETQKLREQGCDIVVWTSHNDAKTLKERVGRDNPGVDLVIGGHSHVTYVDQLGEVAFMQSKAYGHSLTHATLRLNKDTRSVSLEAINADDNPTENEIEEDAQVAALVNEYQEKFINPVKNRVVGSVDADLTIKETLSNLCVYSMAEELKRNEQFSSYEVRAAFHNVNGGVRKDILAGEISYGNVYESFPFDNEIVILKLNGYYLYYDFYSKKNNTAIWHSFETADDIKDDEEYYIITTDFLLTNNDYYAPTQKNIKEVIYTNIMVRDAVANQIKLSSPLVSEDYSMYRSCFKR